MTDKTLSEIRAEAGRKGGKSKSVKGIRKLPVERRREIARRAAQIRWEKHRREQKDNGWATKRGV